MRKYMLLLLLLLNISIIVGCSSSDTSNKVDSLAEIVNKRVPYQTCIENYKPIDQSSADLAQYIKEIIENQKNLICAYTLVEENKLQVNYNGDNYTSSSFNHHIKEINHDLESLEITSSTKHFDQEGEQYYIVYEDFFGKSSHYRYANYTDNRQNSNEWSVDIQPSPPIELPRFLLSDVIYMPFNEIPFDTLVTIEQSVLSLEEKISRELPESEQIILYKAISTSNDIQLNKYHHTLDKPDEGQAIYEIIVNSDTGILYEINMTSLYEVESQKVLEQTLNYRLYDLNKEQTFIDRSSYPNYNDIVLDNGDVEIKKDYLRTSFNKMTNDVRSATIYIQQHVLNHRVQGTIFESLYNNSESTVETFFEQNIDELKLAAYSDILSGNNQATTFVEIEKNRSKIYNSIGGRWNLQLEGSLAQVTPEYMADEMSIDFINDFNIEEINYAVVYYSEEGIIITGDYPSANVQTMNNQNHITNTFKMIIDPITNYLKYFELVTDSLDATFTHKVSINKINETKVIMTTNHTFPTYFEDYRIPLKIEIQ